MRCILARGHPGRIRRGDLRIELHGIVIDLHQVTALRHTHKGYRDPGSGDDVLHISLLFQHITPNIIGVVLHYIRCPSG